MICNSRTAARILTVVAVGSLLSLTACGSDDNSPTTPTTPSGVGSTPVATIGGDGAVPLEPGSNLPPIGSSPASVPFADAPLATG